jgi:hypothetical protein
LCVKDCDQKRIQALKKPDIANLLNRAASALEKPKLPYTERMLLIQELAFAAIEVEDLKIVEQEYFAD